jgi:hypothetical protein
MAGVTGRTGYPGSGKNAHAMRWRPAERAAAVLVSWPAMALPDQTLPDWEAFYRDYKKPSYIDGFEITS